MSEKNNGPEKERRHSSKVMQSVREDPDLMLRDIHKVLVGDNYGKRGLITDVKKNTAFRYKRQEERRVQIRFSKIVGSIATGGGLSWLAFKDKFMQIIDILTP